jgi:hypothetical protein
MRVVTLFFTFLLGVVFSVWLHQAKPTNGWGWHVEAQDKKNPSKAIKFQEERWDGVETLFHWECPNGFHVYWWEVNIVTSPFEYTPQCRENDKLWGKPKPPTPVAVGSFLGEARLLNGQSTASYPPNKQGPEPEWNEQKAGYWKCPTGYTEYVAKPVYDMSPKIMYEWSEVTWLNAYDKNGVLVPDLPEKPLCIKGH